VSPNEPIGTRFTLQIALDHRLTWFNLKEFQMRRLLSLGIAALGASMMFGCSSNNEFTPGSEPTQLAAYAAKNPYPADKTAKDNLQLTAVVNHSTGNITVRNFGTGPIEDFRLWVNQAYVMHVDRIEPGTSRVFSLSDLYSSGGDSLKDTSPEQIHKVQIQTSEGKLWNVQGPQVE
jgi:hypothetical protein